MMVLYSPDWTNTGFSFILLTVNLFRHSTLTEQGLYLENSYCLLFSKHPFAIFSQKNHISVLSDTYNCIP